MSRIPFESVHGYKIAEAVSFDDKHGSVLAHNPPAAFPMATWQFTEENGKREYFRGHYYLEKDADVARLDFAERIDAYKRNHPAVAEKYNYLASAEMSSEDNYNQIDGIPNNGFKPSILDQLREMHQKSADTATDKPGKSTEIEI